jgi:hypothetical protein
VCACVHMCVGGGGHARASLCHYVKKQELLPGDMCKYFVTAEKIVRLLVRKIKPHY